MNYYMEKKYKVLWLTLTPSCYMPINQIQDKTSYNGCGWLASAEKEISKIENVELSVAFILDGQPSKVKQSNTTYYPIPPFKKKWYQYPSSIWYLLFDNNYKHEISTWGHYKNHLRRVVDDFKPDIIHVWGSEGYLGLVSFITTIPVCLHIQGILNPYNNAYLPPFFSWSKISGNILNIKQYFKNRLEKKIREEYSYRERVILKSINNYMGRTIWDYRLTKLFNINSRYYHVDEILRTSFYNISVDRILPQKLTIISTISYPLYKGYDLVLKTAKLLCTCYNNNFEWLVFGNVQYSLVEKEIGISHKEVNVILKGVVAEQQLKEAELKATLYFHPSYIDNSPNSICEAQMIGLPVIATHVGGVETLVNNEENGYLIPSNDPYQGAYLINELYINKEKNILYGSNGQNRAKERHDKKRIIDQITDTYYNILKLNN